MVSLFKKIFFLGGSNPRRRAEDRNKFVYGFILRDIVHAYCNHHKPITDPKSERFQYLLAADAIVGIFRNSNDIVINGKLEPQYDSLMTDYVNSLKLIDIPRLNSRIYWFSESLDLDVGLNIVRDIMDELIYKTPELNNNLKTVNSGF